MRTIVTLVFIIFTFVSCSVFDQSKLTHVDINGILADKWHEESCSGSFDGNGNYIGESCSDEYTIVVIDDANERHEYRVSNREFKNLIVQNNTIVSYDIGRLGIHHNFKVETN